MVQGWRGGYKGCEGDDVVTNGTRIVVQLADGVEPRDRLPGDVRAVLTEELGEFEAQSPHPDVLPGLFRVTVPSGADAGRLVERLSSLPSVKYAEPEQIQEMF
jgi:hypothetical protein